MPRKLFCVVSEDRQDIDRDTTVGVPDVDGYIERTG